MDTCRHTGDSAIKQQPISKKRMIGVKLSVIARQLRLRFDQAVQLRGVTRAKWSLIAAVATNPGATQRSIAAVLEVREVTAGRLIDRLCSDGLLERRENPSDRRAYCVYLTAAAQPMLDKLGQVAREHEEMVFANLSDEELNLLDTLLDRIARNVALPNARQNAKARADSAEKTL